ncbi:MAG: hypothetical protein WBV22_00265 [Anaerolineaceae bacterium]
MLKKVLRSLERVPVPLILFFACVIAYGPLIPFLGFYWDDLPNMWVYHMFGPQGYISYASNHRPFSAWVFILTTPILGESPLGYHVLSLILRWAGAVGVWWTLKQLWPSAAKQVAWVALLFAIYPGFRELPIASVFNVHLICLMLTFLSFGGMLWAVRHPKRFWLATILSLMASAISIFTMEYFITLEILRPVFLWMVLKDATDGHKGNIKKSIILSLPYMAIFAIYGIWRIFIFKFPYYVPVLIDPNQSLIDRVTNLLPLVVNSLLKAGFLAWLNPFTPDDYALLGKAMRFLFWFVLVSGTIVMLLLLWYRKGSPGDIKPPAGTKTTPWSIQAILIGVLALFLAGWPLWIAGLQVDLEPLGSRFTLPFILGSALLLTGLIDLLPLKSFIKVVAVCILVGLSSSWHLQATNLFRYEWELVKDLYWQMTWRAPALKPGTALLANDIPLRYYSDNSLTAMLNWTFAPDNKSMEMPYLLDYISVRLGAGLPELKEGLPLTQDYSSLSFTGTTDDTIAIFVMPPSCLRFIDHKLDDNYQRLPALSAKASILTNLNQIQYDTQATPPINIFGSEPSPDWCYYYEKADLARQREDWATIVEAGDLAFTLNDNPNEATERLPFIEGYAHLNNWTRAIELSRDTYLQGKTGVTTMLCNTWARMAKSTVPSPDQEQALQIIKTDFGCKIP